jgi:hypothetical protein
MRVICSFLLCLLTTSSFKPTRSYTIWVTEDHDMRQEMQGLPPSQVDLYSAVTTLHCARFCLSLDAVYILRCTALDRVWRPAEQNTILHLGF